MDPYIVFRHLPAVLLFELQNEVIWRHRKEVYFWKLSQCYLSHALFHMTCCVQYSDCYSCVNNFL